MADAKKCDICGKFYMPPAMYALRSGYSLLNNNLMMPDAYYDLCLECNEKLNIFVESMKENHDGEREEV